MVTQLELSPIRCEPRNNIFAGHKPWARNSTQTDGKLFANKTQHHVFVTFEMKNE